MNKYNTPELREARKKAYDEALEKAKKLVETMTLEEKISQLTQYTPYFYSEEDYNPPVDDSGAGEMTYPRVGSFISIMGVEEENELQRKVVRDNHQGIPAFFAADIIHGYRTTLPTPLAQSCTWDPEIARKCCEVAAREARRNGTHWTFAPMVDIARDPRWGRIVEGYGEDPFLCSDFAAASVVGFQGEVLGGKDHILCCLKHFAAYGAAVGGRDYDGADISLQTLHDVYLPSFKAGVEAGAATLMSAFETLNGVPASGNKYLLWDVLREMWGFEGFMISDWDSIAEMIKHGVAEDERDAAAKGFGAGVDVVMVGNLYNNHLPSLVRDGVIPEWRITRSAEIIIAYKYILGLMDEPYTDPTDHESTFFCDEHLAVAREAAAHSVVLLENDGILPLVPEEQKGKKIAVVGPGADNGQTLLGAWAGLCDASHTVTLLQGLREAYGEYAEIEYIAGTSFGGREDRTKEMGTVDEAIALCENADIVILCAGECSADGGEASSKSKLYLRDEQEELIRRVKEIDKGVITLFTSGKPMIINSLKDASNALLAIWQGGTEAGHGVADVLTGKHNPSGRLTASFPRSIGQLPVQYSFLCSGRPLIAEEDGAPAIRYFDEKLSPLYTFGYGLSYTDFEYTDLRLSSDTMSADGRITVTVSVENKGKYDGYDVVQLYVRDLVASSSRPVRELKGYAKEFFKAGEKRDVSIELYGEDLAFTNWNMEKVTEPGKFKLWIAHNARDGALETEFWVK